MQPRKCAECGAEFTPKRPLQKFCSIKCNKKVQKRKDSLRRDRSIAGKEERAAAHALMVSEPVANLTIMTSRRKPRNTSAVRWRIELRRRANPNYYAMAGEA